MEKITFKSEGYELNGALYAARRFSPAAVVFCHGAFECKDNWTAYAEQLAGDGLAGLIFDFAGHGESDGLRNMVDMRIWAYNIRDALSFLVMRGYRRFGLVGWGSGGSAVVLAAAHDPRAVCAVALSTPIFLMPPLGERLAFGMAAIISKVKKAIWKRPLTFSRLKEFEETPLMQDPDANLLYLSRPEVREALAAVPLPESLDSVWIDLTRAARKVKIPLLILHGSADAVVPVKQSELLYNVVQGPKQRQMIEGAGHALHLDQWSDEVYQWIVKWIRSYL